MSALRRGFTLLEVMLSLGILLVVLTAALTLYADQLRVFQKGAERMAVLQNLSYASARLEQDLRATGSNIIAGQPFIVFAGGDAVAINADYATNIADDPFAVYHDPDAPDEAVVALAAAIGFPGSGFSYPDTVYATPAGIPSPAETITLTFEPDTTTAEEDDFALWRRVNDLDPELVARSLLRVDGAPFFEYHERIVDPNGTATYAVIGTDALPLAHTRRLHQASGDTGAVARIDRIRAVRFRLASRGSGAEPVDRRLSRLVRMPNAGLQLAQTCGDRPILGVSLGASPQAVGDERRVRLTWSRAVDERSGERDVVRYVVFRRVAGEESWTEPYVSIPAGQASGYTFFDTQVSSGMTYQYALAAQDCTPAISDALALSGNVVVP